MVLKLFPNKCVKDRTDAKVKVGNSTCDFKITMYDIRGLSVGLITHQPYNVVWSPARKEKQDNEKYQPDSFELGNYLGRNDGDSNPNVAIDNNRQRKDQEKQKLDVKSRCSQHLHIKRIYIQRELLTESCVHIFESFVENHWPDARQAADHPNCST